MNETRRLAWRAGWFVIACSAVGLLLASVSHAETPGVREEWESAPDAETFARVKDGGGYVVALSDKRWTLVLDKLDAGEACADALLEAGVLLGETRDQVKARDAEIARLTSEVARLRADIARAERLVLDGRGRFWKGFSIGLGGGLAAGAAR